MSDTDRKERWRQHMVDLLNWCDPPRPKGLPDPADWLDDDGGLKASRTVDGKIYTARFWTVVNGGPQSPVEAKLRVREGGGSMLWEGTIPRSVVDDSAEKHGLERVWPRVWP